MTNDDVIPTADVEVASCCSADEQATCCEPGEKSGCCGATPTAGGGCGCR